MLAEAVQGLPHAVVISDATVSGLPLLHVNAAFETLTGYSADETVGRNCRFLQGAETDQGAVKQVIDSVRKAEPVTVELVNYRKDGSAFNNCLTLKPVHDSQVSLVHDLASFQGASQFGTYLA